VLQIGRSLVRFQMVSLEFFIDIILPIRQRKANCISHILRRNCLLQQVIEGKIKAELEVTPTHAHQHTHTPTHTHQHTYTHTHTNTHIHQHTHSHTNTHIFTFMYNLQHNNNNNNSNNPTAKPQKSFISAPVNNIHNKLLTHSV
jgi:ABC-type Zn2+ transport system substrate-binding protein/surface adhesin